MGVGGGESAGGGAEIDTTATISLALVVAVALVDALVDGGALMTGAVTTGAAAGGLRNIHTAGTASAATAATIHGAREPRDTSGVRSGAALDAGGSSVRTGRSSVRRDVTVWFGARAIASRSAPTDAGLRSGLVDS